MSKTGVSSTPVKQDNNQFKKEIRGQNNSTPKDDKRQSDSFISPGSRQSQQHGSSQNQSRDRSETRNDSSSNNSNEYNKNAQDMKAADKEEKGSSDPSAGPGGEKKFTGRCRLFVGNLTPDITEDEFRKMFFPYGECSELYVNTSRGFGFIRLDYRQNAEAAKAALDGLHRKGRILRVRFASHGAALKVKNLHPFVSNELLEQSFSQFGDLERCVVIVDDRGKPTSEGIVEFVRKPGANSALRRITEGVFLMGADPKPIAVEPLEQKDEEDGMPEKFLTKTDQYKKEREKEPRFAPPGTFEYEFGMRWKQLEDLEKQRIEQIKKDTEDARLKLEDEMQNALYEYQAEQIRQDLRRQQEELIRLEEMRNQDRLRRQQEHEIRRQQDERERAQQEERRRADTMMMMRQQELARGRGPMDIPGLRGRDEMMMSDRYGDRMPDRMGDRMPDRMGDRMPDRMGDRMPDRMGDRMPDRMGDRMPDRMGDRMPDRMGDRMPDRIGDRMPDRIGDRMPDRMGDRMAPGQQGFMWDDKQRGETGMRGEAGRGRGSGAPPLQPPPVPPSAMNTMDRGSNNPASAPAGTTAATTTATQGSKSSPKPLMQGSGFGGAGNTSGTGQTPNASASAAADANAMDEDCPQETDVPDCADTENADIHEGASNCLSTFHKPELYNDDSVCSKYSNLEIEIPCCKEKKPSMLREESEKDLDYRSRNCRNNSNSLCAVSDKVKSSVESLNVSNNSEQDMFDHESDPLITDNNLQLFSSQSNIPHYLGCDDTSGVTSKCHCDKKNYSSSQLSSGNEFIDSERVKSVESFITCSNSNCVEHKASSSSGKKSDNIFICDIEEPCKYEPGKFVINNIGCHSSSENHFLESSDVKGDESYESSNNSISNGAATIQKHSFLDHTDCSNVSYSECDYHSFSAVEATDSYQSVDTLSKISELVDNPQCVVSCYKSSEVSEMCNTAIDCKFFNKVVDTTKESNYFTEETSNENNYCLNEIKPEESEYKQSYEEYKLSDYDDNDEYKQQTVDTTSEYKQLSAEIESCYKQTVVNEDPVLMYKKNYIKKNISSYKQRKSEDTEEMDAEILDEDDVPYVSVSSNVYQSYEENSVTAHYQTTTLSDMVNISAATEYGDCDIHTAAWNLASSSNDCDSNASLNNFQTLSSQTYTDAQNTISEATTSSAEGHIATSTCLPASSSTSSHPPAHEDDHKAVFCTGDQNFKPSVARQPAMNPFMPSVCSLPYVSGINPSLYAGAAVVQGLGVPTVMTSSSVHIAQHPGGATIMQHQSMSTGLNGGLAQATVMQQQAVSSGVQATSMLQHRTLTNGGQTVLVQQRTMTTGLGGLARQTVVQQRLTTPGSIAQAAIFHANTLRHQSVAAQQASLIQQRGVRLLPARMMGNAMMQSQTLGNSTVIRGSSINPATLIGHGLVRGSNNGPIMQHIVRQQYLGGPIMTGRGIQVVPGRPVRLVNK